MCPLLGGSPFFKSPLFGLSKPLKPFLPLQESKVSVTFDPPTAPLTSEEQVVVRMEPQGPSFELRLRGTATEPLSPSKG